MNVVPSRHANEMCTTEQFDIATFQTFKDNKLCKSGTNENLGPASFDRRKNRTFQHFDPKICIKEDKVLDIH